MIQPLLSKIKRLLNQLIWCEEIAPFRSVRNTAQEIDRILIPSWNGHTRLQTNKIYVNAQHVCLTSVKKTVR